MHIHFDLRGKFLDKSDSKLSYPDRGNGKLDIKLLKN